MVRVRETLKERLGQQLGFSVSYTDILVGIVAQALREYTYMNSTGANYSCDS